MPSNFGLGEDLDDEVSTSSADFSVFNDLSNAERLVKGNMTLDWRALPDRLVASLADPPPSARKHLKAQRQLRLMEEEIVAKAQRLGLKGTVRESVDVQRNRLYDEFYPFRTMGKGQSPVATRSTPFINAIFRTGLLHLAGSFLRLWLKAVVRRNAKDQPAVAAMLRNQWEWEQGAGGGPAIRNSASATMTNLDVPLEGPDDVIARLNGFESTSGARMSGTQRSRFPKQHDDLEEKPHDVQRPTHNDLSLLSITELATERPPDESDAAIRESHVRKVNWRPAELDSEREVAHSEPVEVGAPNPPGHRLPARSHSKEALARVHAELTNLAAKLKPNNADCFVYTKAKSAQLAAKEEELAAREKTLEAHESRMTSEIEDLVGLRVQQREKALRKDAEAIVHRYDTALSGVAKDNKRLHGSIREVLEINRHLREQIRNLHAELEAKSNRLGDQQRQLKQVGGIPSSPPGLNPSLMKRRAVSGQK
ncbi:hypothetical protein HK104_007083 [Borealophlyctis nickersoniae]|nr:hypothetical protein HK104_007083 [Borealophlyctis nickersoniae]